MPPGCLYRLPSSYAISACDASPPVRSASTRPPVPTPGPTRDPARTRDGASAGGAVRKGDAAAWSELVQTQHRRIYALCFRFTGNAADAEDLTQDVFLKVHRNLANFDISKGSFQTWLTTLARNLLVDHFRRSRQDRATDSIDANWEQTDDDLLRCLTASKMAAPRPIPPPSAVKPPPSFNRPLPGFRPSFVKPLSSGTSRTWITRKLPRF